MPSPIVYRFGPFEADLRHAQLRKYGVRVRLERKPWLLLLTLLEHPGELVARADLERRLWGEDVFVDFEHGVNVAVKKVRVALCDSAADVRYIETVAGEGYRFIAPVEIVTFEPAAVTMTTEGASVSPIHLPASVPAPATNRRHLAAAMAFGAVLAILAIVLIAARLENRSGVSHAVAERVTGNAAEQGVSTAAISPDGRYLAFVVGHRIWLKQMSTGDIHPIQVEPQILPFDLTWYSDSASLLAMDKQGVWRVSILGGGAQKIFGPVFFATPSPDGKKLAITTEDHRHVLVADSGGENARQVAALPDGTPGYISHPAWSPHGERVAYMKHWNDGQGHDAADIETVRPDGTNASVVLNRFPMSLLLWLNDGRIVYGAQKPPTGMTNFWVVNVDESTGRASSLGEPITDWPDFKFNALSVTADGHTISFVRSLFRVDVYTADLSPAADKVGQLNRASFGTSFSYTDPGAWEDDHTLLVTAKGDWQQVIMRQPVDGSPAQQVLPPMEGHHSYPQVSPDRRWLLWLRESNDGRVAEVLRMPRTGGPVETLDRQTGPGFELHCPLSSGDCIFAVGGTTAVLRAIDPETRVSRELFTWNSSNAWDFDIAPDGDKMIVSEHVAGGDKVFIVDLPGGNRHELRTTVSGVWRWLPNGNGWLVSHITIPGSGSELLRVYPNGENTYLWKSNSERYGDPQLSPDGLHLALARYSTESNVWLLHF